MLVSVSFFPSQVGVRRLSQTSQRIWNTICVAVYRLYDFIIDVRCSFSHIFLCCSPVPQQNDFQIKNKALKEAIPDVNVLTDMRTLLNEVCISTFFFFFYLLPRGLASYRFSSWWLVRFAPSGLITLASSNATWLPRSFLPTRFVGYPISSLLPLNSICFFFLQRTKHLIWAFTEYSRRCVLDDDDALQYSGMVCVIVF